MKISELERVGVDCNGREYVNKAGGFVRFGDLPPMRKVSDPPDTDREVWLYWKGREPKVGQFIHGQFIWNYGECNRLIPDGWSEVLHW